MVYQIDVVYGVNGDDEVMINVFYNGLLFFFCEVMVDIFVVFIREFVWVVDVVKFFCFFQFISICGSYGWFLR